MKAPFFIVFIVALAACSGPGLDRKNQAILIETQLLNANRTLDHIREMDRARNGLVRSVENYGNRPPDVSVLDSLELIMASGWEVIEILNGISDELIGPDGYDDDGFLNTPNRKVSPDTAASGLNDAMKGIDNIGFNLEIIIEETPLIIWLHKVEVFKQDLVNKITDALLNATYTIDLYSQPAGEGFIALEADIGEDDISLTIHPVSYFTELQDVSLEYGYKTYPFQQGVAIVSIPSISPRTQGIQEQLAGFSLSLPDTTLIYRFRYLSETIAD